MPLPSHGVPSRESILSRAAFIAGVRNAISEGVGFAAGKLGFSEQMWLAADLLSEHRDVDEKARRAFALAARFHADQQYGVYPTTGEHAERARSDFLASARCLDYVAVAPSSVDDILFPGLNLEGAVVDFHGLEPNRMKPYIPTDCFLPALQGKRLLLISTPADFLATRATKQMFEQIWRSIECPWFEPHSVTGLAFPSVFDSRTRHQFKSSSDLLDSIKSALDVRDFDVALIAGSSLGVPLAAHVKSLGRVGLSLGGHLQVLFGVQGKRWLDDAAWQEAYVNDAWTQMPPEFIPIGTKYLPDDGAYW